ncbi:MerR family transcriptional regulator [Palleronia sp. LCG004]|uniref:MerR family transcriptional regulator n=1 Tax=Palleronia sp. LCG004 TaxID=3079304 RepID=UPI002943F31C|nr:MerR family transcriptional regulator [Palleronia sp. LCG004]WOI57159.1 MerR family transcriptional regulator [Palleronia sp. LCG004]
MAKSPDAFRTISEVAEWLDVPTHVLRFWESRFTQVKPVKRAGGRRYYRPSDMELLGGIKRLLHDDGLTIRGVQKLLREEGVRHVAALSPPRDPDGTEGQPTNVVSLRKRDQPEPDVSSSEPIAGAADETPGEASIEDTSSQTSSLSEAHSLSLAEEEPARAPLSQPSLLDESSIYVPTPGPLARLMRLKAVAIEADRELFEHALDRARVLRQAMDRADG